MGENGTVESRTYTYSTSFSDGRVANTVPLPLMNGTQFMVCMWVSVIPLSHYHLDPTSPSSPTGFHARQAPFPELNEARR